MLEAVEKAGVFAGYLEDLCYTPKTLKAIASVAGRRHRRRDLGPLARDPSRAAQRLVLGRPADRRRRDHRPRLPLHRDHPQLRRQGEPAGRGHVPHRHARPPDRRRGQRDRPDPVRVRRDRPVRGELDVPRRHGPARRGGRHARHDLDEPLPADGLRDVHRRRRAAATWRRRPRRRPAGSSPSATRSPSSATSTCSATCSAPWTTGRAPQETFYDGYVVNAIMDACYRSAKAGRGSRSTLEWRGGSTPRIASTPETLRGPGRHQARDPARRAPQADPQGPGDRRLHRPGRRGRLTPQGAIPSPGGTRTAPRSWWSCAGVVAVERPDPDLFGPA